MDNSLPTEAERSVRAATVSSIWHAVQRLKERRALSAARRAADAELAVRPSPPLRLAWRVEELVSMKNRLDLAHFLQSLVRDSRPRYVVSASPVNRRAIRAESDTLLAVARRLADVERPVAARGVVLVEHLLVDPSGPLYDREIVGDLPAYLDCALDALEPR